MDFTARTEYAYINNYKVLQAAFNKLDIDKVRELSGWGTAVALGCRTPSWARQSPTAQSGHSLASS